MRSTPRLLNRQSWNQRCQITSGCTGTWSLQTNQLRDAYQRLPFRMPFFKRSSPFVVFASTLLCGAFIGAALPRAQACSPGGPPFFSIVSVAGDAAEVQKWEAFREADDLVDIAPNGVRVDDGSFWHNWFVLDLGPAQ